MKKNKIFKYYLGNYNYSIQYPLTEKDNILIHNIIGQETIYVSLINEYKIIKLFTYFVEHRKTVVYSEYKNINFYIFYLFMLSFSVNENHII